MVAHWTEEGRGSDGAIYCPEGDNQRVSTRSDSPQLFERNLVRILVSF
jgi:hypothetical protein